MDINKFGGASIQDAFSIKRMAKICIEQIPEGIIVVSAMGKTTNHLEKIAEQYFSRLPYDELYTQLYNYYLQVLAELFKPGHSVFADINNYMEHLKVVLNQNTGLNFDFEYDKIVSFGELISSSIVAAYLNQANYKVALIDIRTCLKTDSTFREGKIDWHLSFELVPQVFARTNKQVYLTQGFLGSNVNNQNTTLGREGSDYTAAILANILDANKVVVWKDVPGVLSADPAWLPNTNKLDAISYTEAIEMTYFGAKVIHPKTIKPLQNKNIPLQVRSFINSNQPGTIISDIKNIILPPVYIRKENQILISISPIDFSFIVEENLSHIFGVFAQNQIKVNLMQNSAISFTVSVDGELDRVKSAIRELKKHFTVKYNDNLELISIRHNTSEAEAMVLKGKEIMLEQKSRSMARFVVRV